jgi:hypothetical protein
VLFVKRGAWMLYWKGALQHRILRDRNHMRNHARLTLIMFVPDQSFKARVGAGREAGFAGGLCSAAAAGP